ncbi:MAG: hypothetical protein R3229_07740 [Alphaproteobacteria bacterium]|nr:hypothetical protein [Alphaproteobacteria bacterium]
MMTATGNFVAVTTSPAISQPIGDAERVSDMHMVIHGNWCGPNHPPMAALDGGKWPAAVDALDSACMKHDLCYLANGNKPTCECDRNLIWRVKYLQYHADEFSAEARTKAYLMLTWFEASPCSKKAPRRTARNETRSAVGRLPQSVGQPAP